MRYFILFFLLFFCPMLSPATSLADDLSALEAANRRLRAEYELASQSQIYFMFDLEARKVQFKASGLAVAELPVHAVRFWGPVTTDKVRTVASKHSLFTPEREVLKIPSPEESAKTDDKPKSDPKKFELAALELSDMPSSFQLRFDDGLLLTVSPAPEGVLSWLWRTLGKVFWYLSRPLLTLWSTLHKENYTEILLTMPPRDAQLLYWSLTEGASCLLVD
jgi:hypothetical protein